MEKIITAPSTSLSQRLLLYCGQSYYLHPPISITLEIYELFTLPVFSSSPALPFLLPNYFSFAPSSLHYLLFLVHLLSRFRSIPFLSDSLTWFEFDLRVSFHSGSARVRSLSIQLIG